MGEASLQDAHETETQIADELAYRPVIRVDELSAKLTVLTVAKAVTDRPDTPAGSISCVDQRDLYSGIRELTGSTQPGESGSGDDDLLQAHDLDQEQRECHV
jgi:hypothetical protein